MASTNFTPGPWYKMHPTSHEVHIPLDGKSWQKARRIASCSDTGRIPTTEDEANATLISQSPSLYAVLEAAKERFSHYSGCEDIESECERVLAKARGEQ